MHLIVVKNRYGDSSILSGRILIALSLLVLAMMLAFSAFVFKFLEQQNTILTYQGLSETNLQLEQQLVEYKDEMIVQSNAYGNHIDAFGVRLAQLQSEVTRINALGERLVSVAGINVEEFNFTGTPAAGGPDSDLDSFTCAPEELSEEMVLLDLAISSQSEQIKVLSRFIEDQDVLAQSYISGRPIADKKGWLSSYYGKRKDPFENKIAMHKGVDYAAKEGSDIIATGAGVVTWAGSRYGYGNLVEVNHGNGLVTRYGHAKEVLVQTGDIIQKGSVLALVGSTGRSTGPHTHYEVLVRGVQVNPEKYIYRDAL